MDAHVVNPRRPTNLEGFTPDPDKWPDDGGAQRVPIYDHIFGQARLVRRVGWTQCLSPQSRERAHRFFSPDVQRVRMCPVCKQALDNAHWGFKVD